MSRNTRLATLAMLVAMLAVPLASTAHKPVFLSPSTTTKTVPDASVSYAAYGTFRTSGDAYVVRGPLEAGDPLIGQILLPDAEPERSLDPDALPTLTITTPSGSTIRVPMLKQPTPFHEPITQTDYLTIANLERSADRAGTYTWRITANGPGRFVMVSGKTEKFGGKDVVTLPKVISTVRTWAEGSKDAGASSDATSTSTGTVDRAASVLSAALRGAVAVAAMMLAAVIGIATRDNSYVDLFWGPNFVAISIACISAMPEVTQRAWLMLAMVTLWAVRLTWHLGRRKRGMHGEDFRYAQWREQWGRMWLVRSLLQVYALQGVLALIVGTPILVVAADWSGGMDGWMVIGACVWLFGLVIEMVADAQVARFVARRAAGTEHQRMCTTGLWSISRHPNYLGEVIAWWGIGIVAAGAELGWAALIGPAAITLLIRFVSGVPMLEAAWKDREGFDEWAARTPVFLPLPRRRR